MELAQLSDCPEHLRAVGSWIYEQWWRTPDNTPEIVLSLLRQHVKKDTVPYTVVAIDHGVPAGSCCVIENDCVHRPQYAPWVAAVFVQRPYRGRGVASLVLQEAAVIARRTGIDGLYIDCHIQTVPLYEKNGWRVLEERVGSDHSVVMHRNTKGGSPSAYPAGRADAPCGSA